MLMKRAYFTCNRENDELCFPSNWSWEKGGGEYKPKTKLVKAQL